MLFNASSFSEEIVKRWNVIYSFNLLYMWVVVITSL